MNLSKIPYGFFRIALAASFALLAVACSTPPPGNSFAPFDEPPVLQYFEKPQYPESARKAGLEGEVKVKLMVNEEGRVVEVALLESNVSDEMNQAALEAAQKCRFKPAKKGGKPVRTNVMIPFQFSLNR